MEKTLFEIQQKHSYIKPECSVIALSEKDVITTSDDWALPVMPLSIERETPGNIEYR